MKATNVIKRKERVKTIFKTNIIKTRKNAIVEYGDYQIPATQLKGPKGNGDMLAANAPPTGGRQI